ncbi:MAG: NAD(P)-dependent oxidoreductase [bacterium]|nr:NAD(P)-dependent oxidoreductase [bacterium]
MTVSPAETQLGWIGTGVMGASMAGHLMAAGFSLTVNTRSRDRAAELEAAGATWADTPAEVAAASDVTFAIVGFPADVRDVFLGDSGALAGAAEGSIVVDMTTSEPSLAVEIAEAAKAKCVGAVDAPVSGGDVGARNAALSIMIGGEEADVARVMPLFEIMGKNMVHCGGPGAGQHTKMVNQILIATGMIGVSEALLYAQEAGLDLDKTLAAVGGGAAGSWSLANYGPRMLSGDFEPGFFVDHFVKDMGIALDESKAMRLSVPGLALAHQLYVALQAQGGGRNGTQALLLALAKLSDVEWSRMPEG